MRIIILQSGSNGNSIFVEANGTSLLLDAGISGRCAEQRLAEFGRHPSDAEALVISHDHSDHCRSLGIFQRKFGVPVHVTAKTLGVAARRFKLGTLSHIEHFAAGQTLSFGGVRVETLPTPHDSVDGVGFIVDDGRHRFGMLTDLGHVFDGLGEALASLDAVLLESNYDPRMLEEGRYPPFLQARIRGSGGHLSNVEAARLLAECRTSRLAWACLGHLSADNNEPELTLSTHRRVLGRKLPLSVAGRYGATGVFEL